MRLQIGDEEARPPHGLEPLTAVRLTALERAIARSTARAARDPVAQVLARADRRLECFFFGPASSRAYHELCR